jgi:hypothetical protein
MRYHPSIPRLTEWIVHKQSKCARVRSVIQAAAVMGLSFAGVARWIRALAMTPSVRWAAPAMNGGT